MRHIRRAIGIGVVGIIAIFVIGGFVMPRSFSVERSGTVNAPVERVYGLAADLSKHPLWNARKSRDESMVFSFPEKVYVGAGAFYDWTSKKSGAGRCTIQAAEPFKKLTMKVSLIGKGEGEAQWRFQPVGSQTKIIRSFHTEISVPLLGPWILLMLQPEDALAADFDLEIETFRQIAESGAEER